MWKYFRKVETANLQDQNWTSLPKWQMTITTLLYDESNTYVYCKRQKQESTLYIERGEAHTLNIYLR